ncbi:N-formylglutamate deformylase [Sphingobium sp.]|uniref:N-formylglutamate deformylase n=1 Tax=Sphingobium sp. TaxID=1912891 RepID=UPI002D08049D|nr:N-formylglutamate deformylase [Sphingobium sp.]HUD93001.1 N-formylglutamate deformylase [Sphingobium sp.]
MTDWLHVGRADTPLLLAFPHGGSHLPVAHEVMFRSEALALRDTDWHIRSLYDGLAQATYVWTDISRSIIDCNRDPAGVSLYPGQATTGLCPTETFDGEPLYRDGHGPDVDARLNDYFRPYHAALQAEIDRLLANHDRVVLLDCHSIRSQVPRLFDGLLPELNFGTNGGATCDPALERAVLEAAGSRSQVVNGRFRGGWTTRHYGRPERRVHAFQLEIAQRAYLREPDMDRPPRVWRPPYDPDYAVPLRADLSRILAAALSFALNTGADQ